MALRMMKTTRRTNLAPILAELLPFSNSTGSLYGGPASAYHRAWLTPPAGWLAGDDLDQWNADAARADYVVVSYQTPIAWHTPDGWYEVGQRFSVTTSNHQGQVRRGLARPVVTDSEKREAARVDGYLRQIAPDGVTA